MPKIVVEGPDGRKFAFPDTMPRAEINAFMRTKYGTKARDESVQDYLARFGREQAATEARVKDIDREATAVGRAEGERAAERMGVSNPFEMAFAAPAIGLAQQEGGRRVFEREGTVLADEAAGLSAINAAGFFVPGMVNREFGARVEEGRRQQPLAAFAGDVAGGFGPGEIIGAGVSKAVQAIGPGMAALGRMLSRGPGPDTSNAIVGGTLGGIAPAETAEERARNVAVGAGLGYVARPASQAVDRVSDRVLGSGNPNLKGVDKKRQAYTFDVGGAKAKVTFEESFPDDGDYPRRVPTDIARLREDVRQEYLTPLRALDRSVETIVPDRYNRAALGPTGPTRTLQDSVNVEMDISNANLTLPQAKQLFEKTFDTFEDHAIRHRRPVYYFTGAKPSQQTLYENSIKRRGAPKGYVATTGPDGFYFVRDDLFQNFAKELQDDGYDVITRTASNPRATAEAVPAGGYFNRQSMRPPGSGPSPREIELRQEWSTATPIVTQARTTAQSAQQAAEAALQSKAPADIARAKAEKKALVGQLQEAQASRAGMNTPEDARLAETLASLTENTSDPVLLSTQISAAKTSLDRLLTDIGSPVEGNLIPVKTNILTRTQAPRSAAEGPQDRASVTRYAAGTDEVKPQGFGAGENPASDSIRQKVVAAYSETEGLSNRDRGSRLKQAVEDYRSFVRTASADELRATSDLHFDRDLLFKLEAPQLAKMMKTLGLPAPSPTMALNEMRDAIKQAINPSTPPPISPMGFGAGGSKTPTDLSGNNLITERRMRQDVLNLEGERAKLRAEAQAMEDAVDYGSEYTPDQRARFGEIDTRLEEIDRLTQETYTRYSKLGYNPEAALNEDVSLIRFVKKPLDQITPEDVAEYDRVMAGSAPAKSGEIISFAAAFRAKNANQTPPLKPMGFGASTPKTPQQAARFETPGSPEYEAAVAKGLDMSQAGRMARAKEMGFDTDTVLYHGTDKEIASFRPSERGAFGPGVYLSDQSGVASRYGKPSPYYVRGSILDTRPGKPLPKGLSDAAKSQLTPEEVQRWERLWPQRNSMAVDAETFREVLTRSVEAPRVPEIMRRLGFDGMQGIADGHELVIFDPSNIRSCQRRL
jgi:hypothetical protein